MKNHFFLALLSVALLNTVALKAQSVSASYLQGTSGAPTVSSTDLLQTNATLTASSGTFNSEGSTGSSTLIDGTAPAGNTLCAGIASGASLTYTFSGSAIGYDISSIDIYTSWVNNGRVNPNVTVSYSLAATPTVFVTLGTYSYSSTSGTVWTKSHLAITSITGVAALKFDFPSQQNGYVGYSEIDVFPPTNQELTQDVAWDFASNAQGWHDLGVGRDVSASWESGALKMTYIDGGVEGTQLWFPAVQVEQEFDASSHKYLEISYRTINWPTTSKVKFLVQFMNSNNEAVYAYADLDPTKNFVSIDIAALDPGWGKPYTGIMKQVQLELPHNGDPAANLATNWFGASTMIDKVLLTNTKTKMKVAHWSFDTNYTDDISNISGAASGNPTISAVSAKVGTGALVLDGDGDYLRMAANPVFSSGDITYTFWMKTPVGGQTWPGAARIFATSGGNFDLAILNGNISFFSGGWPTLAGWQNNVWAHVALVLQGDQLTCYINGIQVGATITVTGLDRTKDFLLGSNGGESVIATIDELSIFNYALTPTEIQAEMVVDHTPRKVAHWTFDTNYTDDIGNISGAVNGNPAISGASAKVGTGALVLDGNGSYLRMAANPVFSSNDITYTFWMKTPVGGQTWPGAARLFSTSNSSGFELGILNGNISFLAGGSWQNFVNGWQNDVWTRVAIVAQGDQVSCYINGVKSGSTLTATGFNRSVDFLLGSNGAEAVIAAIDELSIYNYALTLADIEVDAGIGTPTAISQQNSDLFNIYPSPNTTGFLNVTNNEKIDEIFIYSITGKLARKFYNQSNSYSISDLQSGIYIVSIKSDNNFYNKRLSVLK